jgi:hypothetical protein
MEVEYDSALNTLSSLANTSGGVLATAYATDAYASRLEKAIQDKSPLDQQTGRPITKKTSLADLPKQIREEMGNKEER